MVINPLLSQANPVDQDLVALIFNGLSKVDPTGRIVPDLAERYEISNDGMVYTFFLRQDAQWHDGAPVTSADVVFTVNVMQNEGYEGMAFLSTLWRSVVVEQLDSYTVRFILREPFAPFLEYTTIGLLPAHILGSVDVARLSQSTYNAMPVGTGPYKVDDIDSQRIVLVRNDGYYGARPYLDRLELYFYPDADALLEARQRGEIMGMGRILPRQLAAVQEDEDLTLYSAPLSGYTLVFLNLDRAIFQDRLVRQAMMLALDRQALVDDVLQGQGTVIDSPILPQSWAYNEHLPAVTQDLRKARTLLEQAGWFDDDGDGFRERGELKLEFKLATNDDDAARVAMVEMIAKQLAEVGIHAIPEFVKWEDLVGQQLRLRRFDAVLSGWQSLSADPDPYPYWHSSQVNDDSVNFANYISTEADTLLAEARRTTDPDRRWSLYQRFQELFVEDMPSLLLYQPVYNFAVDKAVMGVQIAPMTSSGERFATLAQWHVSLQRMLYTEARDQGLIAPAQ
ncbi:MAG: peptide ABC transporter substrate-binding protein [Chloroflexi bacterium]|nr:peptide ABC transporter substrate-binding protein [Chloroflexota bacterium]